MPSFRTLIKRLKQCVLLALLVFLSSCSLLKDRKGGDYLPITIDLTKSVGSFTGLGANVPLSFYNRRTKALQTLNDLQIKYIRVKRSSDNWNDIMALKGATHRLNIQWIYSLDKVPAAYLNPTGQLVDVEGFALWWADEVDELNYQEVPADLIELISTPDLNGDGEPVMDADTYNQLIHATRRELDLRNFNDVGIIGPGLSNASIAGDQETWYVELDQEVFNTLDYWSVQAWESPEETEAIEEDIADFLAFLDVIDSKKPVLITPFGTQQTIFDGSQYPDPNRYDILGNLPGYESYYYSATFSLPYGLELYATILKLLATGGVTPFIHQLYDAPDEVKYQKSSWGLLDLNGQPKPAFQLLSILFKAVPDKAEIVPLNLGKNTGKLSGLVFKDRSELTLTLCNEDLEAKNVQVAFQGADRKLVYAEANAVIGLEKNPPLQGRMDQIQKIEIDLKVRSSSENKTSTFQYTMAPQSTLVVQFELN